MAGLSTDRGSLDLVMGQAILNLRVALDEVARINSMLQNDPRFSDAILTADPTTGGCGYTADEMTNIKPAFLALTKLRQIAHSSAIQAQVNDFFFFANNLTGVR